MHEATLLAHKQIVGRHIAAENAHQLGPTLATLHPQCVFEDVALARSFHGHDGAEQYYRLWWDAFAVEVQGSVIHWTTEGQLIAEARYVGRHIGEFFGLAPTGRSITVPFAVFVGFRDGLMAGERFYYDLKSLLQQLGAPHLPALT